MKPTTLIVTLSRSYINKVLKVLTRVDLYLEVNNIWFKQLIVTYCADNVTDGPVLTIESNVERFGLPHKHM